MLFEPSRNHQSIDCLYMQNHDRNIGRQFCSTEDNQNGRYGGSEISFEITHHHIEAAEEYLRLIRSIWNTVASPFLKVSQDEIRDFIDEEDYDDGNDVEDTINRTEPILSHRALYMQSELEEFRRERDVDRKLAAHYEQLVKNLESDNESNDSEDNNTNEEELYIDESQPGLSIESDDDEDDWQKTILIKRVVKVKSTTPRKRSGRRVSLSTSNLSPLKRSIAVRSDSDVESPSLSISTPLVRKRLAIHDSDDEE
jgi:hypothetical protein